MENFKFKEDKSKINCDSAASWEKTPDTKVDEHGYDVPISGSAQDISNGRKGENDVEMVKQRVAQLELKVDVLEMKEKELERRCLEAEEEKERMAKELSEEIKVVKEMFTNKMCEMQRDLLAMVEHCLNFEKELSQTKEENQKMQSRIIELVEKRDRRMMEQNQLLAKDEALEKAGHTKKSTVEEVANSKTPGESSNKCRIVTVSSGSLGSTPSPSKSPPTVPDLPQVIPPSPRSTEMVWHNPTSAPLYVPGQPQGYGAFDQPYAQYFPPTAQHHYPSAFYPYGEDGKGSHQNPELIYYNPV